MLGTATKVFIQCFKPAVVLPAELSPSNEEWELLAIGGGLMIKSSHNEEEDLLDFLLETPLWEKDFVQTQTPSHIGQISSVSASLQLLSETLLSGWSLSR